MIKTGVVPNIICEANRHMKSGMPTNTAVPYSIGTAVTGVVGATLATTAISILTATVLVARELKKLSKEEKP